MTDRATIKWLHRNGWIRTKWLFDKDDSYLIPPGSLLLHTKVLLGMATSKIAFELEMPSVTTNAAVIVVRCEHATGRPRNLWVWVWSLGDAPVFRLFLSDSNVWVKEPKQI